MNHKIQEIIWRETDAAAAVYRSATPVSDYPGVHAAIILRAVKEVIGEAGVEGALEVMLDTPYQSVREQTASFERARAALRTLKELHQSAPVTPANDESCDGCRFLRYVKASPFGSSSSGPGCLKTGGHAIKRCEHFQRA